MPSPLPPHNGLHASRVRTPASGGWATMRDWLVDYAPAGADVDGGVAAGRYVLGDGTPLSGDAVFTPGTDIWFHRDLPAEPPVPFSIEILHQDERLVVVDKPHFLATMPRGIHVAQTVVTRLRQELGMPELSPAHRLDRLTAGVLVLTTQTRWRGAYQCLFADRGVTKVYEAIAGYRPDLDFPRVVRSHIVKERERLTAYEIPGADPNAETRIELLSGVTSPQAAGPSPEHFAHYRLHPVTGKTHQLRVHLTGLGIPIVGDPLYPEIRAQEPGDFSDPLRLLARSLSFADPIDGSERTFTSRRALPPPREIVESDQDHTISPSPPLRAPLDWQHP